MTDLRSLFRLGVREADQVGDADHPWNAFRVGLGAAPLIRLGPHSGNRHPAVFNIDIEAVSGNRQIPIESVQNAHAYVFSLHPHLDPPASKAWSFKSRGCRRLRLRDRPPGP